ncbi:hypothetical protein ACHWQZ_G003965 [Mnemiopsis leidyi]
MQAVKAKTVSKSTTLHLKTSREFRHLLADWSDSDDMNSDEDWEMTLEERLHLTGRVPQETTTVSKAYFNLTVCVIASALLSIPYSFDKTGWLVGVPLLAGVGFCVDYTLLCLGETCMKLEVYDYQELCEISFGKLGRYIQALIQLALSFSLMISYQIISAENLMGILRADWVKYALDSNVPLKPTLILLLTIVIILPVSSFATLKMLGNSSMISLVSILILSLSLLYFDLNRDPPNTTEKFGSEGDTTVTKRKNYNKVIHLTMGTSFIFFVLVGLSGYYLCHDPEGIKSCPGNILAWSDPTVGEISENFIGKVAMGMFLITALVAYPLEHFSCFNTLNRMLYGEWGQPSSILSLIIKLGLVICTTLPAIYLDNIGPLLAWAGTLAAFPLGFLLPLSLSLKHRNNAIPLSIFQIVVRWTLLIVSAILMILQTFQNIPTLDWKLFH